MLRATLLAVFAVFVAAVPGSAEDVVLLVEEAPPDGLVMAHIDLTAAAARVPLGDPARLQALDHGLASGEPLPFQFIPDHDAGPRITGTVLLRLPAGSNGVVRLVSPEPAEPGERGEWDGVVPTDFYTIRHEPGKQGGMPSSIAFAESGRTFDRFRFNDRLHDPDEGGFTLAGDAEATAELISRGPLATVVRTRACYVQGDTRPALEPRAVYDWYYFHDRPWVFVRGLTRQAVPHAWKEIHFLELSYPREAMPHWVGGEPVERGKFRGDRDSFGFPGFAAVHDGANAVGMFRCGKALLYDGGPGTYLQARGDEAWNGFDGTRRETSAWLWLGPADKVVHGIRTAENRLPDAANATVTLDSVRQAIAAAKQQIDALPDVQRRASWWRVAGARRLAKAGRFDEARDVAAGRRPETWTVLSSADLGLILERTGDGIRAVELFDIAEGRRLLADDALPLFALSLENVADDERVTLSADRAWSVSEEVDHESGSVVLHWAASGGDRFAGLRVTVRVRPKPPGNALGWSLRVDGVPDGWTLWDVTFPQLPVAEPGPGGRVFFPRGCGEVQENVWDRSFRFGGTYPSGWTSMQWMAAYDRAGRTGLYVAAHDPFASTKEVLVESRPPAHGVVFSLTHPAPAMGSLQNQFATEGEIVWRLFRGDWFDAAMIYRDWVRCHARWYPKLGPEGREDTPMWMRSLPAWGLGGGGPRGVVPQVKRYAEFLGVPVGYHWYNWHQIPFDNDYPHYFPAKEGFVEGVAELQKHDVYVMPYINGRLWDTRDRGLEDHLFSTGALPAATKNAQGEPYVETYGSQETDGSRVRLAAMCPATALWQDKVAEIVGRLFGECGVRSVYIDQVAAAKPQLCFDADHGHPLGGGHWWTESYWEMIGRIRQKMPEGRALTTECNAEPYIHVFDGYLTWHWQYDGQVPAFPAVYGGTIQMFGRAYRGGPTKDRAFCMKAGQQLVFGEQIGWCNPGVVNEKQNAEFLRQVVRLRWHLARYFYAGEMARPPRLIGQIPRVTADWQWRGRWPVTTDAVMTGAWQIPTEKRVVLLLVNVSNEPVRAAIAFSGADYALPGGELRVTRFVGNRPLPPEPVPREFQRAIEIPGQTAWAWTIHGP